MELVIAIAIALILIACIEFLNLRRMTKIEKLLSDEELMEIPNMFGYEGVTPEELFNSPLAMFDEQISDEDLDTINESDLDDDIAYMQEIKQRIIDRKQAPSASPRSPEDPAYWKQLYMGDKPKVEYEDLKDKIRDNLREMFSRGYEKEFGYYVSKMENEDHLEITIERFISKLFKNDLTIEEKIAIMRSNAEHKPFQ